jgi:hypothetical protein
MMDSRVSPLAHVADSRFFRVGKWLSASAELLFSRREHVWRCYQDALAAQLADTGRGEKRFLFLNLLVSPLPFHDLQESAAIERVRTGNVTGGVEEAISIRFGNLGEDGAVGDDLLEQIRGGA